jgi:hypothetical protein
MHVSCTVSLAVRCRQVKDCFRILMPLDAVNFDSLGDGAFCLRMEPTAMGGRFYT